MQKHNFARILASLLPSFLYLPHSLSRHYSRNSRQAARECSERRRRKEISLRFLNTWWSVTFSRMQIPSHIVNLCVCPKGVLGASACLRCASSCPVVVAQSFRKFNLFRCRCCCRRSIVASFLFSNSIFSFTFLLSFFRFRLYLFLFCLLAEGQLQIFAICYSCCVFCACMQKGFNSCCPTRRARRKAARICDRLYSGKGEKFSYNTRDLLGNIF